MIFKKWFSHENRVIKGLEETVKKINDFEPQIKALSDDALKIKTATFREKLKKGETLDTLLPEAFAIVREAAFRTLKQRHFDVQLLGGIVLHQRNIAEMKTGEGKTLVATLPAYLNALTGEGVHVVTVNDYLARRDAVWMGQIYAALGLSVGVINTNNESYVYDPGHINVDAERDTLGSFKVVYEFLRPATRKEAYAADITYGTNNEFGFDYLRDNIAYTLDEIVQRNFSYAIVDEIDSILIDEARTPLIISAPSQDPESLYYTFARVTVSLNTPDDFTVDEKLRAIVLTDGGITKAEKMLGIENIYTEKGVKYVHHLENAIRAKALFLKDKEYVVKDGQIVIVDEFTGRLQPGRRWSEGLHQAIEAKEGLSVQKESRTVASITFQNYFRLYKKLAGMTGTAYTSSEEFARVYNLPVIPIPTHRANARTDHDDLIFQTEKGKYEAVVRKIKELNEKGQPVLVGTVSIEKNETLSAFLKQAGVPHEMLNAKNHEQEGEIIAQAGRQSGVTIATNMAGRGVDIVLSGNPPESKIQEEIRNLGGLFVIGTERHEARRIDNQLRGRSGRQGDPGETQFFLSLEDSLMRVFASDAIKTMMGKFGIPEDHPIENRMITRALESAQTKIEGFHFDARKHVLQYDDVLNHQRKIIYTLRRSVLLGEQGALDEFLEGLEVFDPDAHTVIEKKKKELGAEMFYKVLAGIIIRTIDLFWMEHLETMEYLRSSVNLRAYGQHDPLVEYKKEGLQMFKDMREAINLHVLSLLKTIEPDMAARIGKEREVDVKQVSASHTEALGTTSTKPIVSNKPKNAEGKAVGRNDPCPCGSGKKYKRCHGNA
ncbi:MAG: preprotein translocase subunit SecA [Parcubacteria group bacterium]|nr:preprotein translocase subunit SecA [Parcubacteria group bacterium]